MESVAKEELSGGGRRWEELLDFLYQYSHLGGAEYRLDRVKSTSRVRCKGETHLSVLFVDRERDS